jgi:hypothetical protein
MKKRFRAVIVVQRMQIQVSHLSLSVHILDV